MPRIYYIKKFLYVTHITQKILETLKKYLRVDRREICFLKFIFEAYDGIATLTTIDPYLGTIRLHIAPGCEKEVNTILQDLKKDIMIEDVKVETEDQGEQ